MTVVSLHGRQLPSRWVVVRYDRTAAPISSVSRARDGTPAVREPARTAAGPGRARSPAAPPSRRTAPRARTAAGPGRARSAAAPPSRRTASASSYSRWSGPGTVSRRASRSAYRSASSYSRWSTPGFTSISTDGGTPGARGLGVRAPGHADHQRGEAGAEAHDHDGSGGCQAEVGLALGRGGRVGPGRLARSCRSVVVMMFSSGGSGTGCPFASRLNPVRGRSGPAAWQFRGSRGSRVARGTNSALRAGVGVEVLLALCRRQASRHPLLGDVDQLVEVEGPDPGDAVGPYRDQPLAVRG